MMPLLARPHATLSAPRTGAGVRLRRGGAHSVARRAAGFGVALAAAWALGCTGGEARDDWPAAARRSTGPIGPGAYTVTSAARYQGRTLTILDAPGTRYGAQLVDPGRSGELYDGSVTVRPDGLVDLGLTCDCPVRRDAQGSVRHEIVGYTGRYAARDVAGGRVELRQVDGPAVDTLERVR